MNYPYPQNPYQVPYQRPQQNNTIIANVKDEAEAQGFPLFLGQNGIFVDESKKYLYTKTMGLSQFDKPVFEKYRLEKEAPSTPEEVGPVEYATKEDIKDVLAQIEELRKGAHHESANAVNADKEQSGTVLETDGV